MPSFFVRHRYASFPEIAKKLNFYATKLNNYLHHPILCCIFASEIKTTRKMKHTTTEINRNFKIKVYGMGINSLVGVAGLRSIVEDDALCDRLVERAFNAVGDKQVCKLRRGVKVTFYWN